MLAMKIRDALAAIQVCLFLLGTSWLDGVFKVEELPKFVPEMHATEKAAIQFDDGQDDPPQVVLRSNTIVRPLTGAMSTQRFEQPPSFLIGPGQYNRFGTTWLRSPGAPRLAF
jgi:hypothetical protein